MSTPKQPPPAAIVIFGANGDLTRRLIVPALYNLTGSNLLPEHFALIGVDHSTMGLDAWRDDLRDFLAQSLAKGGAAIDATQWDTVARTMSYVSGDFTEAETYKRVAVHLAERDQEENLGGNALYYLAVADRFFGPIVDALGAAGLTREDNGAYRRVIIEKPFGHDLESAKALNARILKWLREDQIFRIDHFLGKETVQNILALRFANGLFEPIWNRDRIDQVQITVAESIGIEGRGTFYDVTGALRDMVPNHLFQLVAMTAMEPPVSFDAEAIRAEKAKVFRAVHPLTPADAVRGQYDAGDIDGKPVPAYRMEPNVDPHSSVETFVALRLMIDNWRWAGVPFYLRTGKRLPKRSTEIAIRFRQAPHVLFRDALTSELDSGWLILQIQPEEGIRLRFNAKRPGPAMDLESVAMDFRYRDWFHQAPAVGYETLIYDCLTGDATLFQRADQVEAAWCTIEPVLSAWRARARAGIPLYAAGSDGPDAANELMARDGRAWRRIK